ncbi:MAG: M3 family oligoendopeptidase [Chloroflexi bacterium]|nr:M3 family oligoendopeptidase [Chloroflexota bacterium]
MNVSPDIRWKLDDLYSGPTDPQIEADLARARQLAQDFAARYRGKVAGLQPGQLSMALQQMEEIYTIGYKPQGYASLAFSAQTEDAQLQQLVNLVREKATDIFNDLVFFEIELKSLPEDVFSRFKVAEELADYRHYLESARKFAPHTLSEPEERLFAQMHLTGASAWSQLYTEITSSLRFPVEINGRTQELTDAEVRALRTSPERGVRKMAGETLYSIYENNGRVLTYVFNTLFQDHKINIGLRKYQDPIEPTALENELSTQVIELLMSTTEANYGLAQEYYHLKASLIGLHDDFRFYDVLAPYESEERKYEYDEARALILSAFGKFHPDVRDVAARFFEQEWIDATPRAGKRGGAFCSGLLPAYHPYVLTNYTGRLDDVFTLAHELGHGVHFYLARRQRVLNFDPTTSLAEVASVFGEIVLADYLRAEESDPTVRRHILAKIIEDAIATIFRQVMYTRWEQRAHIRRAQGVATAEEYSSLWMEENTKLYGDAVAFDPLDRWGWIAIPHFVHYRFYCFSYAFAHLLAFALYRKHLEEGAAFAPRYVELLASGGKDRPEELLKVVGLNPLEPDFWQRGLDFLRGMLAEFRDASA